MSLEEKKWSKDAFSNFNTSNVILVTLNSILTEWRKNNQDILSWKRKLCLHEGKKNLQTFENTTE